MWIVRLSLFGAIWFSLGGRFMTGKWLLWSMIWLLNGFVLIFPPKEYKVTNVNLLLSYWCLDDEEHLIWHEVINNSKGTSWKKKIFQSRTGSFMHYSYNCNYFNLLIETSVADDCLCMKLPVLLLTKFWFLRCYFFELSNVKSYFLKKINNNQK